ncbi:hypothetical protein R1flu_020181 [Riccia fluitans]|uniref:SIT4 phosphatase-associated family protein n=1 Tax=Riccia fluitans TaxID=41844 RepID=A0ABD1ZL15_9MARC
MFWRVAGLSTTSPVESVLDKEVFTLEELLDEDEIIQECKALNSRLINFLRGKGQVQQMLRYVIEDPPEGAENKRAFKFPFIACEVFTCEIDVIFKTLGEDEELMNLLFSFLEPDRPHGTLLAGYFSKVVICLLLRKTVLVMRYLRSHQEILKKLVDLIGITSIMEVLVRLVGADEHIYAFHAEALQWLADTDLLEMLVDKLSHPYSSEVHANAAETLSAVTRIAPSALASKLASPTFVARLFNHVLEDPSSKSTLIHSLSVCISLLDPKRAASVAAARGQHPAEPLLTANPETVEGMLQRLGELLKILDVSNDEKVLPTTYGQLRPPLGIHRLKIVEFIAVLLRTNSEGARQELVRLGAIQIILNLFFDFPFNNMLHHHVESVLTSCIESNSQALLDHLLKDCDFITRLVAADENPYAPDTRPEPKTTNRTPPRIGNMGHLTRLANKIAHAGSTSPLIQNHLQAHPRWSEWQTTVLQNRNMLENVHQWTCGRPTAVQERPVDSDEDDYRERDYDISTMARNLTGEVYRYGMFDNEDVEEGHGSIERDDEDVYFDDESAEVVISSLRLNDEQDSGRSKDNMFGNKNWFAFQDDNRSKQPLPEFLISPPSQLNQRIEDEHVTRDVSPPNSSGGSSSDDEVVVGEDEELVDTATSANLPGTVGPSFETRLENGTGHDVSNSGESPVTSLENTSTELEKFGLSDNLFPNDRDDGCVDWEGLRQNISLEGTSGRDTESKSLGNEEIVAVAGAAEVNSVPSSETGNELSYNSISSGIRVKEEDSAVAEVQVPLFGGTPVTGVEAEGTAKAMEKALKEGIVGEAIPILPHELPVDDDFDPRAKEAVSDPSFNDVNYWRSDYDQSLPKDDQL